MGSETATSALWKGHWVSPKKKRTQTRSSIIASRQILSYRRRLRNL